MQPRGLASWHCSVGRLQWIRLLDVLSLIHESPCYLEANASPREPGPNLPDTNVDCKWCNSHQRSKSISSIEHVRNVRKFQTCKCEHRHKTVNLDTVIAFNVDKLQILSIAMVTKNEWFPAKECVLSAFWTMGHLLCTQTAAFAKGFCNAFFAPVHQCVHANLATQVQNALSSTQDRAENDKII